MSSTLTSDEAVTMPSLADSARTAPAPAALPPRRRGRPPLMSRERVLTLLRECAANDGLFRVHIDQPALYARARRQWGTWAGALAAAGLDYGQVMAEARRRSVESRREAHRRAKR